MAIRGGVGAFYNRFFTETYFNNMVAQPPMVQTPIVTYGNLSSLASSTGLVYPTNVYAPDLQGKLPMVMNYSLSVQREIGFATVVDVAYAGSLGRHLVWFRDMNSIPIGANFLASSADPTVPGRPLPTAFLRPTVGYNSIYSMEGASSSNYNSLQVTAHRRFANNLQFGLAYTWSKALDYNDTDTDIVSALLPARSFYYGLASFDRTHVLVYQLHLRSAVVPLEELCSPHCLEWLADLGNHDVFERAAPGHSTNHDHRRRHYRHAVHHAQARSQRKPGRS